MTETPPEPTESQALNIPDFPKVDDVIHLGGAAPDADPPEAQTCPACGVLGSADASWCEACGSDYAGEHAALSGPPCIDCGAAHENIVEGYCGDCGRKQPGERDHQAEIVGAIVAASDRGLRHHQNEDSYAIGQSGDRLISVVCDGVSTTNDPQDASLAAATAARDSLQAALDAGDTDIEAALVAAVAAAQEAAAAVPLGAGSDGPASTTIVASVVGPDPSDPTMVKSWHAWLGDSRAYWMQDVDGAPTVTQLTTDDVFENSITRWLGADATDTTPGIVMGEHDAGGQLLACSDGLWKYVPEEEQLAELLKTLRADNPDLAGLELAQTLVAFANEQGGHDNTTVVIAQL